MSSQKYSLLANVTLLHNYFEDGIFRDISVVPDRVTQTFMWNAGLLFRHTDVGFSVFYNHTFDADYLEEITSFFSDHLLRFQLFGESRDFTNYTESPLGRLITYKYSNRSVKSSSEASLLLPKIEQRLYAKSPLGEVDLYLSQFLQGHEIVPQEYLIMYSARSTQWKYYVVNVEEAEADRLVIESPAGETFDGPIKRTLQNGQPAFEFSSGQEVFPFQEKPTMFCTLKKKSLALAGMQGDSHEDTLVENLPVPSPQAITTIEKNETGQVACSSVYVYL